MYFQLTFPLKIHKSINNHSLSLKWNFDFDFLLKQKLQQAINQARKEEREKKKSIHNASSCISLHFPSLFLLI